MSTDRVAVVTGVGRAAGIATRLAAEGWRLALVTAPTPGG
jgi:NAD(P)-dependent dehydrogenase (short-subunit alcohol dehydrogenase family)